MIWFRWLTGLSIATFATRFTKGPWEKAANAVIEPWCTSQHTKINHIQFYNIKFITRERQTERKSGHICFVFQFILPLIFLVEGGGYHISIVQDAHLGEMATKIVFQIYTTMHICKQEMASKIVFRLHNNAHLRARDGYKKFLWIMQHNLHLSVRDDRLQTFVFGLCNMHAPASSQHRREVVECDYTLHIALKVSPLKPNHPSSSSRIPAHRYSNQRTYHLHGESGTVAIICYKNLKDCAQQPDSKPVGGYPVICIWSQLTNSWVILDHYEQN